MRLWPRNRLIQIGLVLLLLCILTVVLDQMWVAVDHRIAISPSTTRLTTPLDHGYPDYLAALNAAHSADVTLENNAAIPICQITGMGDMPQLQIDETFRLLGVPPPPGKPLFVRFDEWIKSHGIQPPTEGATSFDGFTIPANEDAIWSIDNQTRAVPWDAAQHPIFSRYLADMQPALAALEAACRKDRYYFPAVTREGRSSGGACCAVIDTALPSLGVHRSLADTLIGHAMQRLGSGDGPGFSRDILTAVCYSRLIAQQSSLIEHLVAVAINATAQKAIQAAASSGRLSPADALALYKELDRLGALSSLAHCIDESERYFILDAICSINAGNSKGALPSSYNIVGAFIPINYNSALRQTNTYYDRFKDGIDKPDYSAAQTALVAVENDVMTLSKRSAFSKIFHLEEFFLTTFMPSIDKAYQLSVADYQERDLALLALQLRAARAGNHPFPNSLANLENIPNDRFTGKPLIYKRQADGYLLYSLGPNLTDDGGVREIHFGRGNLSVQAAQ